MITLDAITLPSDMEWIDEYDWSPVSQAREISLSGALIIQEQKQGAGRPVTLVGGQNASWATKQTVDLIKAKADQDDLTMSLNYHGQTMSVVFNRENSPGYRANLVQRVANPQSTDWYTLEISLLVV